MTPISSIRIISYSLFTWSVLSNQRKRNASKENVGKIYNIFPVLPLPTDDLELLSSLASDGTDNESFEELFQKLAVMKGWYL